MRSPEKWLTSLDFAYSVVILPPVPCRSMIAILLCTMGTPIRRHLGAPKHSRGEAEILYKNDRGETL
jgi:hypothetical protein